MCRIRGLLITGTAVALVAPGGAAARELGARALHRGDHGRDVRQLQVALRRAHVARLRADAAFGARTQRAVRRYERREGLAVDGWVSKGQARGLLRRAGLPVPAPVVASPGPAASVAGVFPVRGAVTWGDGFGARGGEHQGVDLLADCGTPLVAATASVVRVRSSQGAAGRHLVLTEPSGEEVVYMHLDDVLVHTGDAAAAGQPVGTVGRTGNATACHLHLERWSAPGWYAGGAPVDPDGWLRGLPDQPVAQR